MKEHSTPLSIEELRAKSVDIRYDIINMIAMANAGHPGGSLSAADILTALYFRVMRIDPSNPEWADRDRFILSKGHACPVLYSVLAERGYFNKSNLNTLRSINSILQGHPDMCKTPGVDMSSGSLGQGLSVGIGMALSAKLRGKDYRTWVVIGDGEMQEGSIWEAAMAAPKWNLDNLTAILDYNHLQADGPVIDVMPIEPVADKWRAFGWNVIVINGHDMQQVVGAMEKVKEIKGVPTIIIANTIKGKGVSFMENVTKWHGKAPSAEEAATALAEIRSAAE